MDTSYRLNLDLEINNENMQSMQDAFCKSNDMYLMCISKAHGQITSFSGSKAEEDFVDANFTSELRREIMDSFIDGNVENIIERFGSKEYLMYKGVAIRGNEGRFLGVWLCFGIDGDKLPETAGLSDETRVTTRVSFDKSIQLLETLTKYYFAEKIKTQALKQQLNEEKENEHDIKYKLKKNEIMTDILRLMESENSFSRVSEDILQEAGKYMDCSNTALLQIAENDINVDMISEWSYRDEAALISKFQEIPLVELPFMNGKPYTISSDAILPEAFEMFFIKYGIKAAIFLPINVNDSAAMYLCFFSVDKERNWSVDDLRFANDIKRIMHTMLIKKITTNSLASSYNALESILQNAGYGVAVVDIPQKQLLYTNDTFNLMFDNEIDRTAIRDIIFDEKYNLPELNSYLAKGSGKWFDISINSLKWVDGRDTRMLTFYDITDLRLYQKKVEKQAQEDILTGLYNRQACEKDISLELHIAKKLKKEFAVLLVDLDDFTSVNEGLGYKLGDDLLEYVAHSINDISYIKGKCYRVGGDEFAVLVEHDNYDNLEFIIKRIRALFENPWTLDGQDYYCTISMGCVKAPEDIENATEILTRLNIAVHSAKNKGKNCLEYYSEKSKAVMTEKVKMDQALRKAVEDDCKEFEVYFQPIMEFVDGVSSCCGAEALVRWNSPEYGLLLPEQFIMSAEQSRMIVAIGNHLMTEAIKACKHWNDFGHPDYKVNINLSVVQLTQNDILDHIKELIDSTSINPKNITFEVTESLAINDMDLMIKILSSIRKLGCRVALDDFGTGYSSLNYIRSMPIDTIKIDKTFVSDMSSDRFSEMFIKTIAQLADSLNVDVCVEGVEADEQVDMIGRFSVNLAQGYYFDKPLLRSDFEKKYL